MSATKTALRVGNKTLEVSNLQKVLYPAVGFTKAQVIDYYIHVAPVLLPHLKDRPLTMKRYPNGVNAEFFYEKRCPTHRPDWVKTARVWSEGNNDYVNFCVINDLPTLVWAANLADLELHTSLSNIRSKEKPTMLVFDLDPGPPATIVECATVAFWLKEIFDAFKLQMFPKTSGSKGLQLYVPLNTPVTYERTKPFAQGLAQRLEREHPREVVSKMQKALRGGKVFIDWSQNDTHKTTVCAYSLRAKERPTVSTPVTWEEVDALRRKRDADWLVFTSDALLKRVDKIGDIFEPVLTLKQKLPKLPA
ncbi:MAG TPA: non-homologous end-joining DNA ligase [Candidatus Acidoferrum sp.]|nr:non-homologous end-joining DNA ligase [Candidatus Acidoferrum sp.]